jgi:hypothetical protein
MYIKVLIYIILTCWAFISLVLAGLLLVSIFKDDVL